MSASVVRARRRIDGFPNQASSYCVGDILVHTVSGSLSRAKRKTWIKRYVDVVAISISIFPFCLCDQNFDPYALNGGLVAAIAGKDYVVFSSDTRLTSGGYDILSRRYLSSRVWPLSTSFNTFDLDQKCVTDDENNEHIIFQQEWDIAEYHHSNTPPFTWIASAGCAADCEALKRYVQAEYLLQQSRHSRSFLPSLQSPQSISKFLANVLYSRRLFPFYSFCILAGLCIDDKEGTQKLRGVVHIYDAIGSHEESAVVSAGTGREILQPILDRLFTESSKRHSTALAAIRLRTSPVPTHVECPVDEAVGLLLHGYRAASEREIQVGDSIVVGILQHVIHSQDDGKSEPDNKDDNHKMKDGVEDDKSYEAKRSIRLTVQRYLLKQH